MEQSIFSVIIGDLTRMATPPPRESLSHVCTLYPGGKTQSSGIEGVNHVSVMATICGLCDSSKNSSSVTLFARLRAFNTSRRSYASGAEVEVGVSVDADAAAEQVA